MSASKDQPTIDALAAKLTAGAPSANGNGTHHPAAAADKSDDAIIELCRNAKNAAKFVELFDHGNTSQYDLDDSRADQALISLLAFYTQDPGQLDRIFQRSALYRADKWGKRDDYRQRTINKALAGLSETYSGPSKDYLKLASSSPSLYRGRDAGTQAETPAGPSIVRLSELGEAKPREWIVHSLLPKGYPAVIYGDGGVAKSMIALSLASAIASDDKHWLDWAITTAPVLYCDFELDADEQNRRARQLARGNEEALPPAGLMYMSALGYDTGTALVAALEACQEHGIELMVLDSLGPALQGDMESSNDVIGFFRGVLEQFRAAGVTVLIIDHQSKTQGGQRYQDKTAFGSVYKSNLVRSTIQVEATESGEGTLTVRARQKKTNFGSLARPFCIKLGFTEEAVTLDSTELDSYELAEEGTLNATDRVKLALGDGPAYPWEIADATELQVKTVKNALTGLRKQGIVEATGEQSGRTEQVRLASRRPYPLRDGDGDAKQSMPKSAALSVKPGEAMYVKEAHCRNEVEAMFERPPKWLNDQLGVYFKQPGERLLKPLCAAVARELGYTADEVRPHVEAAIADDWRTA